MLHDKKALVLAGFFGDRLAGRTKLSDLPNSFVPPLREPLQYGKMTAAFRSLRSSSRNSTNSLVRTIPYWTASKR